LEQLFITLLEKYGIGLGLLIFLIYRLATSYFQILKTMHENIIELESILRIIDSRAQANYTMLCAILNEFGRNDIVSTVKNLREE